MQYKELKSHFDELVPTTENKPKLKKMVNNMTEDQLNGFFTILPEGSRAYNTTSITINFPFIRKFLSYEDADSYVSALIDACGAEVYGKEIGKTKTDEGLELIMVLISTEKEKH